MKREAELRKKFEENLDKPITITQRQFTEISAQVLTNVEDPGTEDQPGFTGWKIETEEVYEKDEYIKLMAEKNDSLDQQATDLQLALAEVYEQIIS